MKQLLLTGIVAASLLAWGCQGTSKQAASDTSAAVTPAQTSAEPAWKLEGTKWKLKEFPSNPMEIPAGDKDIYMQFTDTSSEVRGFLGCNGFGGKYLATPNGDLQITNVISTQMACERLNIENAFGKAMEATSKYTIEKDLLRLQKGDSILATFTALKP
ncbi:META domain-containing protein [Chitinophaga lutea]|uniref:META domain-containing protein n=1 Tax=Chitinophaga lutea TaxID=2488634 RepID=A0A3N4PXZ0_9BACT|nr:META domain-containing protein [Chitinophaga lutea]RPE13683.1 META domain-containing protein [Chitinophaga lutea]